MWFPLALGAMLTLVLRRTTEKRLTGPIPASSMAWIQQLAAMPFMLLLLPFAHFYTPDQLSLSFYIITGLYILGTSIDAVLYFKAVEVGDMSIIAPLLSLAIVTGLAGSYVILGQSPTWAGLLGCVCIMAGGYLASRRLAGHATTAANNRLAITIILILVVLRGIYGPSEVLVIRETNPIYFNFVTSLVGIPVIMLAMWLRGRQIGRDFLPSSSMDAIKHHRLGILFIGLTYTINLTATYTAKLLTPNAAYVTTIKGASVLPIVLIGMVFFQERVVRHQWFGLALLATGLACFAIGG